MDVFDGLPILFPFERASDEEGRRRSVKNRKEEEEEKKKKKKKKKGNELFDSNSFESKHLLHKTDLQSAYTRLHRNQYVVKRTSNREQIDDTGLREDFDLTEKFSKNKKEEREREKKRKELKSKRARSVMAERRGGR